MEITELPVALHALSLTRAILDKGPIALLLQLLDCTVMSYDQDRIAVVDNWSQYAASLLPYGGRLEDYLKSFLAHSENICVKRTLDGQQLDDNLAELMQRELGTLSYACTVSGGDVLNYISFTGVPVDVLPSWKTSRCDLYDWYTKMLAGVRKLGFGIFRDTCFFSLQGSEIIPVHVADPVTLDQLYGYEWQRRLILENLRALTAGEPAANMLLYGDSGTGKSSTIKAAAYAMFENGLRLIEVRPSQLHHIPAVLQKLALQPLKFILFIDDLSFSEEDDDFRALKGTIEGSVLCRAANVIVCATSNRRKMIRETFSERGSDDVHANETIQQQSALSDRFGLSIPFMDPNRDAYLGIVAKMAKAVGILAPEPELFKAAERFALEKGGRTGRAARQFVDLVKSGVFKL